MTMDDRAQPLATAHAPAPENWFEAWQRQGLYLRYAITISIPIHVQTFFTQRADYIMAFPTWYSYFLLPVLVDQGARSGPAAARGQHGRDYRFAG